MNLRYDHAIAPHYFQAYVSWTEFVPGNHDQVVRENWRIAWDVSHSFDMPGPIVTVEVLNRARAFEATGLIEEKELVGMRRVVHHEQSFRRHKGEAIHKLIELRVVEFANPRERGLLGEFHGVQLVSVHHD